MPSSGDVVELDLGTPEGREAGFRHPAVVVTAQRILDAEPSVIHVVPLTSTIRSRRRDGGCDNRFRTGPATREANAGSGAAYHVTSATTPSNRGKPRPMRAMPCAIDVPCANHAGNSDAASTPANRHPSRKVMARVRWCGSADISAPQA